MAWFKKKINEDAVEQYVDSTEDRVEFLKDAKKEQESFLASNCPTVVASAKESVEYWEKSILDEKRAVWNALEEAEEIVAEDEAPKGFFGKLFG